MNIENLLLTVQKPARYIGGEWNSVRKEWDLDRTKILLAFPDVYEVGMSYLGMRILYGLVNERDDCLCERVFSPWPDFEGVLRSNKIDLFSLESRSPIKDFDIIGFSLAYELSYTNVLNILDLGGIPKRSRERDDAFPIIIAGGPSCYNPEPIAEFIDAFIVGDGEEVILEIIDAYKAWRGDGKRFAKQGLLRALARIEGVYVPSFYGVEYNEDRTIKRFFPTDKDAPPKIKKRIVKDLDKSYYPTCQIVPNIQIVHDRIAVEILRGCKHACKFCMAGAVYRPYRERSKDEIIRLVRESYKSTGYEEVSLLSLSSGDHSRIKEIMGELNGVFNGKAVSVSVPSLRIQGMLTELPALISCVRKAGLTFAPESGSTALRRSINKDIDLEGLFRVVEESFKLGWNRVKLYFMIGLPTETEKDVSDIITVMEEIANLKRAGGGRPCHVTASINAFVPKPHTPFQCNGMESLDVLYEKRQMLRKNKRSKFLELDFNSFERSYMEGVFSRGDRAIAEVLYDAWEKGCRFDSWLEFFKLDLWLDSFKKVGIDPDFYVKRDRPGTEILPWSFIDLSS